MSIGTMGAVSPHSRQSRDTRALRNEARKQTALLAQIADPQAAERARAAQAEARLARAAAPASALSLCIMVFLSVLLLAVVITALAMG
jgi:hypothetical protein